MRTHIASTTAQYKIKQKALELFHKYSLHDWSFYFNDNRSRLGICKEYNKSIELSVFHVDNYPIEAVMNILLHEIAHAIVGCGHQHNNVWKRKAIEIGCTGDRCGHMEAPKKYTGQCPNCENIFETNKRTDVACSICCKRLNGGRYSRDFAIIWN